MHFAFSMKLLYLADPPVLLANKDRLTLRSTYTKLLCADLVSKYPSACTKHYYISSVFITCKTSVHDYAACNACAMLHDSTPDSRIVQLNAICKLIDDCATVTTMAMNCVRCICCFCSQTINANLMTRYYMTRYYMTRQISALQPRNWHASLPSLSFFARNPFTMVRSHQKQKRQMHALNNENSTNVSTKHAPSAQFRLQVSFANRLPPTCTESDDH